MTVKTLYFGDMAANCYLVSTDTAAIVIDPFAQYGAIADFFTLNPQKERYVLLTHCHFDHILGADTLREQFGAKIVIGKLDEKGLCDTSFSLSHLVGMSQTPFYADKTVSNEEILSVAEEKIRVLHTPGHTEGSVCYIIEDAIFTGDTLFAGSVGRCDFPTGDGSALMKSLEKLSHLDKNYKVYPGHGEPTDILTEKLNTPYMQGI